MDTEGSKHTGRVIAVCMSEQKGTQKIPADRVLLKENWGIEGDAHAGNWHRQVSLLSLEKIEEFRAQGAEVDFGAFGENLVISGFDLRTYPAGTRFQIGEALLEITQIGKECHSHCAIYQVMKDCIMPREGVFARVLRGGTVRPGDEVVIAHDRYTAAVITVSDKGAAGEREDTSGPEVCRILKENGYDVIHTAVIPDDRDRIREELMHCADTEHCALIVTTGGTGFSKRDVTPEATLEVLEKRTPGLPELMRAESMKITPYGCLSRGEAGIRGNTLILNLPGSRKAARENLEAVLVPIRHGLKMLFSEGSSAHGES